jgi:hypothetical protein
VIFARASSLKSSTMRHKLDLGAVVAVCWKCDSGRPGGVRGEAKARPADECSHAFAAAAFGLAPTRGSRDDPPRVGAQTEPILSVCQLTLYRWPRACESLCGGRSARPRLGRKACRVRSKPAGRRRITPSPSAGVQWRAGRGRPLSPLGQFPILGALTTQSPARDPGSGSESAYGRFTCRPPDSGASTVQTLDVRSSRLDVMKKRLLITGLVLAALLLALYGVIFGTGAD